VSRRIVVLVPDESRAEQVRPVTDSRYWGVGTSVIVVPYDDLRESLHEQRHTLGDAAYAVVVDNEPAAMEALQQGADEALVLDPVDETTIVRLVDRARARAQLRAEYAKHSANTAQAEKLKALGTLVAGVAHEVNNPLTAVLLSLEVIKNQIEPLFVGTKGLSELVARGTGATQTELRTLWDKSRSGARGPGPTQQLLTEMTSACESIAEIVRDLSIYARSGEHEPPEVVELPVLIDKVLRLVGRDVTKRAIVERDYDRDVPPVLAPRTRLTQVLTNLLVNAGHAIQEIERDVHRVRVSLRADDESILISVSDTGIGITSDAIERIFDPFFTTKRETLGTGLGLSISRAIMRDLGGDLIVDSVHGDGATFVAWLPRPEPRSLRPRPESAPQSAPPRPHTVLVVEPDPRVLGALARFLRNKHEVLLATDGHEAEELFASGSTPDVVVADADALDSEGRPLVQWLLEQRPELEARLLVTHSRPRPADAAGDDERHLSKPIKPSKLLKAIDRLVAEGPATPAR
jgi:signal transduction histidine kinase/CheY-like chemotaxis protein